MPELNMARYYWLCVHVIILLCWASSTSAVHNTTACWQTGFRNVDIDCRVGVIAIISSTSSHSTCDLSGGCCILPEDCTVVSPDIIMVNIYSSCEGQHACSVPMTHVSQLTGCEPDAANYQVVYYGCTSSTTEGMTSSKLSTSQLQTVSTSSYILAGTTSTTSLTTKGMTSSELSTSQLETVSTSRYVLAGTISTISSTIEGTSSELSTGRLEMVSTSRYVSIETTSQHTSWGDQESSSLTSTTPTDMPTGNADTAPDSPNIGLILGCVFGILAVALVGVGIYIWRKRLSEYIKGEASAKETQSADNQLYETPITCAPITHTQDINTYASLSNNQSEYEIIGLPYAQPLSHHTQHVATNTYDI